MREQEGIGHEPVRPVGPPACGAPPYHVFLSHNSRDKPVVRRLAERLKQVGLEPWFDAWCLTPGRAWQEELAAGVQASAGFAFFVGPHGQGDWAREELDLAQDRAAKDRSSFRLFPVLLPGLLEPFDASALPPFLRMRTWVDLRRGIDDAKGFQDLVCAITGVPFGAPDTLAPRDEVCPYRGLLGFDEEHAEFFFGRDGEVQRLLEKLKGGRFLAVLGPSGSGKSSVVRAGLVPALRRGALPGSESWPVRILKPGARPLVELAAVVADQYPRQEMAALLDRMLTDARALDLAAALGQVGRPEAERVVWVVDQFEEVFTLCPDERERAMFLANLLYAAAVPGGRSAVVLTMRADFYHRCAAYPELAASLAAQQFLVSPMGREELRLAIEEPAHQVGLALEAGLVERILADVEHQPGALPLLEHALLELWARRRGRLLTLEGYQESGGVHGAIAQRADEIYAAFDPEQQAIARRVLLRLTQPGEGTEDTRRRARFDELVTRREEREPVERVARALADARLLTTSGDDADECWVDIAHEALIRTWPRLRQWLDDDRAALRIHRRLTEAAREWSDRDRDEDLLFRGGRLEEVVDWRSRNEAALNDLEREFVDASVAWVARERARIDRERAARERLRRKITGAAVAAAIVGLLLAGLTGYQWLRAEDQRMVAEQRRLVALSRQLSAQVLTLADERLDLALLLSLEAGRTTDTLEARGSLLHALAANPRLVTFLHGHAGGVQSVAFSPDGRALASGGADATVRLWDVATGQGIGQPLTGHAGGVQSVAFSPDGRALASGGADATVRLWDVATGQGIGQPLAGHTAGVQGVAFSPDGRTLASGAADTSIRLWDVGTGRPVGQPLTGHGGPVSSLAYSPDSRTLASGSSDRTIRLWDPVAGKALEARFVGHTRPVLSVAFSPDGKMLASGGADATVRRWDATSGQPIGRILDGHTEPVLSVAFSPDGGRLASGGLDRTVRLWDTASGEAVNGSLVGHTDRVNGVAFSPDGRTIASGSADTGIRLWDAGTDPTLDRGLSRSVAGRGGTVESVAFSPDGTTVAAGGDESGVRRLDVATGQPVWSPPVDPSGAGQDAAIWSVAFSPDGRQLAAGTLDGGIRRWDAATGQPIGQPMDGHTDRVSGLVFSPDSRLLASISLDGSIRLWDAASGRARGQPLTSRVASVHGLAFSPDGRLLASGSRHGVQLWDVATAQPTGQPLVGHADDVESVAFSPDGRLLASGGLDRTVRLWDVATGRPVGSPLAGHTDDVESVAFSPDGRLLASGGLDRTVRLWDVATGRPLGPPLAGHADRVSSVAFSPDGRTLVSGSADGSVRVWDVDVESWRARACRRANRNLRPDEWSSYLGDEPYRETCPELPGAQV